MKLSDSDEFWIEQVLRPIALLPVPHGSTDTDEVATIWSNGRLANDRLLHKITAREVRDARRVYSQVMVLLPSTEKE